MIVSAGFSRHPADFAFERAGGFPYWTISVNVQGRSSLRTADGTFTRSAGHAVLIEPRTPYRVSFGGTDGGDASERGGEGGGWSGPWLIADPSPAWRAQMAWPQVLPGLRTLDFNATAAGQAAALAMREAQEVFNRNGPEARALSGNAFERMLILAQTINPLGRHGQLDARVREALGFMARNLAEALDVEAIASAVHLSASHLAHLFSAEMGESPMQHLEGLRMQRAQELLLGTGLAVQEVALAVGYENAFHFSARFRKRVGCSPRNFRKTPRLGKG